MSKNLKVLVSSNEFPPSAVNILKNHFKVIESKLSNFSKIDEQRRQNYEELIKLIPGCSGLIWTSNTSISKELLDAAGPQLKVVATSSAGYDHCAVDELKTRQIKLSNTPDVLSPAVAELAVSIMIAASRLFTENLQQVATGEWVIGFDKVLGRELRGSTVGIIGLGSIGQAVAKRLSGFDVGHIVYCGHREKPEAQALGAKFVTFDELLAQSDYIILTVPLTPETKEMINKESIAKMTKQPIIVNVGRGPLIDQEALYEGLKNGSVYAAGLDVTSPEPLPKDHKLLTLKNVFILPHIGSATVRTRREMGELAANNIVAALQGKPLLTPVLQ